MYILHTATAVAQCMIECVCTCTNYTSPIRKGQIRVAPILCLLFFFKSQVSLFFEWCNKHKYVHTFSCYSKSWYLFFSKYIIWEMTFVCVYIYDIHICYQICLPLHVIKNNILRVLILNRIFFLFFLWKSYLVEAHGFFNSNKTNLTT